jgi:hypothetical protein
MELSKRKGIQVNIYEIKIKQNIFLESVNQCQLLVKWRKTKDFYIEVKYHF